MEKLAASPAADEELDYIYADPALSGLKNKRWFRRQSRVELEVSMVVSITHALSIERYRRMAGPPQNMGAPPPVALAA